MILLLVWRYTAAPCSSEWYSAVCAAQLVASCSLLQTSGLEMIQNRLGQTWTREEVQERLRGIMRSIYQVGWVGAVPLKCPCFLPVSLS